MNIKNQINSNMDEYQQKVLVVDDQPETIYAITLTLKKLNVKILSASNGKEAIEKAETEQPDMIILDIQMPIM
ncbi:MAG TPA: response regulator, partial [bacterium]|nr:response regulator [bacterium]